MRARMSAAPPGAKVLTMRTGRAGHSCADALPASRQAPATTRSARRFMSLLYAEFIAFAALGDVEEQLVERQRPLDQALLMRIGDEPLEVPGVALGEPVLPGVLAEDALLLLPSLAIPGERDDARIFHPLHGERLGLVERLVQVDRHPGMALDDLLLDADHVHNRENAGLAIERDLLLFVVRKQPAHAAVARGEPPDPVGREQR